MDKNKQLTKLAKSFNDAPIPFVPIVVVGVLVAMYVNSMSSIFFLKKMFALANMFHIILTIVFVLLLYRYYKYAELLSFFNGVSFNDNREESFDYNRSIVNKLKKEYVDFVLLRVHLVFFFFGLWFLIKDIYPQANVTNYEHFVLLEIFITFFNITSVILVMEFPLIASLKYYIDALEYQKIKQKKPMSEGL